MTAQEQKGFEEVYMQWARGRDQTRTIWSIWDLEKSTLLRPSDSLMNLAYIAQSKD